MVDATKPNYQQRNDLHESIYNEENIICKLEKQFCNFFVAVRLNLKSSNIFLRPAIRYAVAYFNFHRKILFRCRLLFFSLKSSFSFAEDSLFFFESWLRQRQGLCPCWCKTTRNTLQSAVAYGSASWGVPSPASFKKLDQTLISFATVQLQSFGAILFDVRYFLHFRISSRN